MKKLILIITVIVTLPATSALASDPVFDDPVYYLCGSGPHSVCSGDFNEDGHLDLAVSARRSDRVYIYIGNGDGSFAPGVDYNAGNSPYFSCTCDLNEDGHLDLAVANYESNYVSILLGAGDGTFIYASSHVTDSGACHIDTEDFNEDGHTDLAVVNWTQVPGLGTLSIMLGSGDGNFISNNIEYRAIGMRNVAAADFDEDGHVDLAIMTREAENISVLIGAGDGTFTELTRYDPGKEPTIPVTYDFNGDGHIDFAVGNFGSDYVSVLIGNGNGTFSSIHNYPDGDGPWAIDIADFNQDGNIDIATANRYSDDVSILTGNGDGTFGTPFNFAVGNDPHGICAGDFNEDGLPDLATAHNESCDIAVLINVTPVDIRFDIKPGSCPNPFNVKWLENIDKGQGSEHGFPQKGGVLPAAIVGSQGFDVTEVDVSTLLLEGVAPLCSGLRDVTRPATGGGECACTTEGPDGFVDLTLKFNRQEIAAAIGPRQPGEVVVLTITGALSDGAPFEASDCVVIVELDYGVWDSVYEKLFDNGSPQIALQVLRQYRDRVLMVNPRCETLIDRLYTEHSEELVSILLTHPQLAKRAAKMITDNLSGIAGTLGGEKMELSRPQLTEVVALLNDVSSRSSEEMREYISSVKQMVQKEHLAELDIYLKAEEEGTGEIPEVAVLLQNEPNPFNPVARITYWLPRDEFVRLFIYDVSGRLVDRLVEEVQSRGEHTIEWDAKGLSSGIYFYRLEVGDFSETRKMMLIK